MDINFYSLDFSERRILPPSSTSRGYTSINAITDFNDIGSFQLSYYADDIDSFVKSHPEGYIITWGSFVGYATDFQFTDSAKQLFGYHLNGILSRVVIPPVSISGDSVNAAVKELLAENASWLIYDESDINASVEHITEAPLQGDKFIKEYLAKAKLGYSVYIGTDKQLHFKLLNYNYNMKMLSKGNLNVYELQEDFSNKTAAFGGWYKKTREDNGTELSSPVWKYISLSDKDGIFKHDTILDASSPQEAIDELTSCRNTYLTDCKTRNIEYGRDYKLGDILRLQMDGETVRKQVTSFNVWFEGATRHEEPILTEWEE